MIAPSSHRKPSSSSQPSSSVPSSQSTVPSQTALYAMYHHSHNESPCSWLRPSHPDSLPSHRTAKRRKFLGRHLRTQRAGTSKPHHTLVVLRPARLRWRRRLGSSDFRDTPYRPPNHNYTSSTPPSTRLHQGHRCARSTCRKSRPNCFERGRESIPARVYSQSPPYLKEAVPFIESFLCLGRGN